MYTYIYVCITTCALAMPVCFCSSNAAFFLDLHVIAYSAKSTIPCSSEKVV